MEGDGCVDVGTVLGISRKAGGLVSYAAENPLTRGGSCVGGGGSAYQLCLCGGSGSKGRVTWGGGMDDWGWLFGLCSMPLRLVLRDLSSWSSRVDGG